MRVVTLLPSATEIVYALGVEPVGVSHECDYPPPAAEKPSVNRSRVDPAASSAEINEQVADAEAGDGVYAVDRDALAAVDPDLIVTQGVCDVCAVDHVLVEEAVADLGLDAEVLTMDVHSLADLFESIEEIGAAVDEREAAAELVESLRKRVRAVEETAAEATADEAAERPRVAVLDWLDPVMVAGHWVPKMVQKADGTYDMEEAGAHSRPREWEEVVEYDPEVLVVAPCGFDLDQTRENLADVTERPGWDDLTAVREGRVHLVDGHHYVNRSGPRLVDTLEFLAALIHPDRFERPPTDAVQSLATARR
jgi:iron complex transport system substrate-binding protein